MCFTCTVSYCQSTELWCRPQQVLGRLGTVVRKGREIAQKFLRRQVNIKHVQGTGLFLHESVSKVRKMDVDLVKQSPLRVCPRDVAETMGF